MNVQALTSEAQCLATEEVHVDAGDSSAKFWLKPVSLHYNIGFSARELRAIERIVLQHQEKFVEAWDAHFGAQGG